MNAAHISGGVAAGIGGDQSARQFEFLSAKKEIPVPETSGVCAERIGECVPDVFPIFTHGEHVTGNLLLRLPNRLVQPFHESFFSCRPKRARRLGRLAQSPFVERLSIQAPHSVIDK